jgi:hypothetical protein
MTTFSIQLLGSFVPVASEIVLQKKKRHKTKNDTQKNVAFLTFWGDANLLFCLFFLY